MNIKIIDKNGVTLKTKGKYCKEDISVSVDESILGVTPTGTYQVTNNGEYDITEYAKVNVNVASSGTTITGFADGTITEYSGQDTKVRVYAFLNCTALENVSLPQATSIDANAFQYCKALKSVNLPQVTSISEYAFGGCKALKSIDLPNLTSISANVFYNCTAIESVNIPQAISISANVFYNCTALESVNIAQATSISANVFYQCYSLKVLIIKQETKVCTLSNTNALYNCYHIMGVMDRYYNPDGLKDGYIYVPDSLVDSYKSATNWATYADQIKPLSELPQEYKDLYNIA